MRLLRATGSSSVSITPPVDLAAMGLLYELLIDSADGTTTVRIEADSREEALENGQELFPGCRLALVSPEPEEQQT